MRNIPVVADLPLSPALPVQKEVLVQIRIGCVRQLGLCYLCNIPVFGYIVPQLLPGNQVGVPTKADEPTKRHHRINGLSTLLFQNEMIDLPDARPVRVEHLSTL